VGQSYHVDCRRFTCVKASKKLAIMTSSEAVDVCCAYNGTMYPSGSTLDTTTVGPCHQVSLSCEDMSGVASIAIKLEETCPPPYQDIEDKIDILDTKINEVLANQEDCGAPGGGEGGEGDCWCGARMSRSRIVGGQDADINEHPWQAGIVCVTESCAVLGGLDRPFCGGSLVNSKWVLSAAHCLIPPNSNYELTTADIQVILGDHQWNSETETEHYRTDVINIVNHPNYNEETSDSDFSLLELAKSVTWSLYRHIRPVCLPTDTSEDYVGQLATVTGWGALSWPDSSTVLPDFPAVLQEVNVTVISNQLCKEILQFNATEKMELEAALSEAEGALEQEENKVLRASLELTQVRQEIERRLNQKDDEFNATKKNFAKAIDGMQMELESETKGKVEALRMKKKLESDVVDLGVALEHANAANAESQRNIKRIQVTMREVQGKYEEEVRAKTAAQDALIAAERRVNANQNALEEARTLLEQSDRNRRMIEQELADTNETLSQQTCTNQAINGAKSKCESEMNHLGNDLDEMSSEAKMSEDKAQRAMIDAARLADELRAEQEGAMMLERDKKLLEAQVKDAQSRLDESEQSALKGGKKAIAKMETRIRELESELDAENRRLGDAQKNMRKSERHIKELSYSIDEDKKNQERMQGLIDQLQGKIKSYKKQIEEAEEIAALNLAKYRQVQTNLAGAHERADVNEQALAKAKARSRASSLAPM